MNIKFHDMLKKKRDLKPSEKHAKMSVLKDMKQAAASSIGDKLDGMKKVSIMSDSPEGLQHGLETAHDMISKHGAAAHMDEDSDDQAMAEGGEVEESPEEEASESPSEEMSEQSEHPEMEHEHEEDMELEAIKQKIEHLMMLQKEMESKQR